MRSDNTYRIGLDIGSTTVKMAVVDADGNVVKSFYQRHYTRIHEVAGNILKETEQALNGASVGFTITGSVGMGISEKTGIGFIQEVVASTEVIKQKYPEVKTLVDIGGEDSKMIFFHDNRAPDIRMNGNCAGGTGAFIDQTASLLGMVSGEINAIAEKYSTIYPIASRCGVFAKTDIQNLVSRKIPVEDILASVFHAVCIQSLNTLVRGFDINPKVMFSGGPFYFFPFLTKSFIKELGLDGQDVVMPEHPELLPAIGAALSDNGREYSMAEIIHLINLTSNETTISNRLDPLFAGEEAHQEWLSQRFSNRIRQCDINDYKGNHCFIGIDCGSTTTKIVAIGSEMELLFSFYKNNKGQPIVAVGEGLLQFSKLQEEKRKHISPVYTVVTGYGEDLVKAAFHADLGVVETIAHFRAAQFLNKKVSFILDIGGQDMKAIFISGGLIGRIELNEACSSGCGSFIETFANNLGHQVEDFADMACHSEIPFDLGTRCTVFMNSKVKQALRDNAATADIAAGLAYSVIKNALFKVLKLNNLNDLGDHIVVQGGTFLNPSVHRALEVLTGKKVICSDIPQLMGAYGAAIIAAEKYSENRDYYSDFRCEPLKEYTTKRVVCSGCSNKCVVTRFTFNENTTYYSGNKCEKVYSTSGKTSDKGFNFFEYKYELLFNREHAGDNGKMKIGIPRVLNTYENYPFWHTLFAKCGFSIVLSSPSTIEQYKDGKGSIMSDSICFPAKLVHGHIHELATSDADRIFYPIVVYEKKEFTNAINSFNCPIVTGYPDVIRSAMKFGKKYNKPFDTPTIHFGNNELLQKACYRYMKGLCVTRSIYETAFEAAITEQKLFRNELQSKAAELIADAEKTGRMLIVLAGRPYHIDHLINQRAPEILSDLGADMISEDAVPLPDSSDLPILNVISQWSYPNRLYHAARWVAGMPSNIHFVQINSFSCGPDAIATDEINDLLREAGKNNTVIRVDEISSTGSIKLRMRSLIESVRFSSDRKSMEKKRKSTRPFVNEDKQRTIIAPLFSDIYSPFIPPLFELAGYKLVNLPKPDKQSVEFGLKYSNNEICYPATIVIGDIMKALESGKYKRDEIAVGITQTGGQCRASSYLSLIRKAMVAAGYEDIPVVSVSSGSGIINSQPGFKIDWQKILKVAFVAALYADSLAKMYYSTVVREKEKGVSKLLLEKYIELSHSYITDKNLSGLYRLLSLAIEEFNLVGVYEREYPRIGIVGEIYVKYNSYGSLNVIDWLISQGVEVVVPPLLDFFTQSFVNIDADKKLNLRRKAVISDMYINFIEKKADSHLRKTEKINSKFRYYTHFHKIRDISDKAKDILSLANQYGEGWLIPAEIAAFAGDGVMNVVSLQPFGCIANQVISKGVETKIRDLYPDMNLLFLDFDDGTSEVNVLNRLHFLIRNMKK